MANLQQGVVRQKAFLAKTINALKKTKKFQRARKALKTCTTKQCGVNLKKQKAANQKFTQQLKKSCGQLNLKTKDLAAAAMKYNTCVLKFSSNSKTFKKTVKVLQCAQEKCAQEFGHVQLMLQGALYRLLPKNQTSSSCLHNEAPSAS